MCSKVIQKLSANWQSALLENSKVLRELEELRGIGREVLGNLELGLVRAPSPDDLPDNIRRALQSFGVMNPKLDGMISMPLRRDENSITNFLMISLNGTGDKILRKGGLINKVMRSHVDFVFGKEHAAFRSLVCKLFNINLRKAIHSLEGLL